MLPFLAGLAVGGAAVVAFSNKKELKEVAQKGYEKSKEVAGDIKKTATNAVNSVKDKVKKEEEKPVKTTPKKTSTRKTTTKKPVAKKTTTAKKTPTKTTVKKAENDK